MARQISANDLKGKTFYTNIEGKVVACRFTCLIAYLSGSYRVHEQFRKVPMYMTEKFGFTMECADGSKIYGNYQWLPEIYETIDDCVNKVNSLKAAYIDERELAERWNAGGTITFCLGQEYNTLTTFRRNQDTFKIERIGFTNQKYDILNDKLLGDKKYFKSYEDCQRGTTIEVVTF